MKKWAVLVALVVLVGCVRTVSPIVRVECQTKTQTGEGLVIGVGYGTGFFVSKRGIIVTAAHVLEGWNKVFVRVEGSSFQRRAEPLVIDHEADIAVLRVPGVFVKRPLRFCTDSYPGQPLSAWAWRGYGLERTRGALEGPLYAGRWTARVIVGPGFSGGPLYSESRECVAGVVIRSNMDSQDPVAIFVRPEASAAVMKLLRQIAPDAVRGL